MYQNLVIFQTAADMAQHAGKRQAVTAQNIANADTPGYRAQQLGSFADMVEEGFRTSLRTTRATHIQHQDYTSSARFSSTLSEPSPNGNAVSLEEEMLSAVEISREHNRALTVYRHAMTVIRTSLGR